MYEDEIKAAESAMSAIRALSPLHSVPESTKAIFRKAYIMATEASKPSFSSQGDLDRARADATLALQALCGDGTPRNDTITTAKMAVETWLKGLREFAL